MVSKEQMDRIINVILSDDKLFHYVMRLINQRVNTVDCLEDPDWCVQVVDITIAKVFQEVKVVELVRRVLSEHRSHNLTSSSSAGSPSRRKQAAVDQDHDTLPKTSRTRTSRESSTHHNSNKDSMVIDIETSPNASKRRQKTSRREDRDLVRTTSLSPSNHHHPASDLDAHSHQDDASHHDEDDEDNLDDEMKPNYSFSEPEQVSFVDPRRVVKQLNKYRVPPDAQNNTKSNLLSIEIEDDSDYSGPEHGRNLSSNDIRVDDEKGEDDSDASTVQVVISPNNNNANNASNPTNNKKQFNYQQRNQRNRGNNNDDDESISSKEGDHLQQVMDDHEDEYDELFIMPSNNNNAAGDKAVKSRYDEDNSNTPVGRKSPGKVAQLAAKQASSSMITSAFSDDEEDQVPVRSVPKPVVVVEDHHDHVEEEDNKKEEGEEDILDDDEDVKAWERKVLANLKDDESQDFSIEEEIPEDASAGDLDTRKERKSAFSDEDDDDDDFKHHRYMNHDSEEHDEPLRASKDDGFRLDIDEVAKQFEQTQSRSVESFHNIDDDKYEYTIGSSSKPLYFDQSNFDAEADAAVSGKPVKKVRFDYDPVKDIFYREKTLPIDKNHMYYTHEEESQFCRDQNRECIKADTLGMSWMEYMNSRSEEEVVEDEYADEHYDEYDDLEEVHDDGVEDDADFGHELEHYYHDDDAEVLRYTTSAGDRIVFTDDLPEHEDSSDNF